MSGAGRILQVAQVHAEGGVPRHVLHLTRGLVQRGWDVDVAIDPRGGVNGDLDAAGAQVHSLPLSRSLPSLADVRVARMIKALDRAHSYRLIHAHSSRAGAIVRSTLRPPQRLVYSPHCFAFTAGFSMPERLAYRLIEQRLVSRCAAVVAVSRWELEQARRLRGISPKLHLIENGVPTCGEGVGAVALKDFRDDRPLAGFVSPLRAQKDPVTAVRAMSSLAARGRPPLRLAIVGNGPLRTKVQAEIERSGLAEHVRLFPFEGPADGYLRCLDLFVLPSRWESLPFAALEALSCGVPVLATDVGGMAEIAQEGETGALVPPGDPAALAGVLERLANSPQRLGELGRAARAVAAERFGLERMVERTAALYEEVIGRNGVA
jgi:glycosyltransferase involved in cell wall biosynthesis